MSTLTPPPSTGAVRATPPPRRRRRLPLFLLLGLVLAIIVAGLLYLLLDRGGADIDGENTSAEGRSSTEALPPSPAPSNGAAAGGGASGSANGSSNTAPPAVTGGGAATAPQAAPSAGAASGSGDAATVGWVGGSGQPPTKATGGLAESGAVGTVLFPTNSDAVDADARQVVVAAADVLKTKTPSAVVVTGYTDDVGSADYNVTLSERRAAAVSQILEPLLPPGWVMDSGKGWADPAVPNTDDDNRQMNRRVTITVR